MVLKEKQHKCTTACVSLNISYTFSFIFFHFLPFSSIFFHFLCWMLKIRFFLGLNFVTISLDSSYVKNHFLGPSRVLPLWALFSFFSYFFYRLSFFLLFIFSFFLIFCSFLHFFDFLTFFIFFFHFSEEKVSSFLFSCISFKYLYCWR